MKQTLAEVVMMKILLRTPLVIVCAFVIKEVLI